MIGAYLHALDGELRVPRRQRERILAEARDHLHEGVAAGLARGLPAREAERAAVEAFGVPEELAARFHAELASASAHRASRQTGLLVAAMVVAVAGGSSYTTGGFPSGLLVWLGGQIAVVAATLGLARSLRYGRESLVPPARLLDTSRANLVAIAGVAVPSLAVLVEAAARGSSLAVVAGAAALVAGSLAAGRSVAQSLARARAVPAGAPEDDALDDLLAVARLAAATAERRLPRATAAVERLGIRGRAIARRSPGLMRWLDLRGHPWRFCLAFGAACGLAFAAQHAIADGGGFALTWEAVGRALAASLLIAAIEAVAVLACFATLGRFLAIRR